MRLTNLACALFAFIACSTNGAMAQDCGLTADCEVETGGYRFAYPAEHKTGTKAGAIVYLHGWQGTPEGVLKFAALRRVANELGVAIVAPRGLGKSWSLPDAFGQRRDDIGFVNAVVKDATERFSLNRDRIMLSGFSLGGSMVWYIACAEGQNYAGYAPIAGSFWVPYVRDCKEPLAQVHHVHGLADKTVPLKGRRLSGGATQGDTYRSFELLREFSSCEKPLKNSVTDGGLQCRVQSCGNATQELCLHKGGHSIRPVWVKRAWLKLADEKNW